jgi:hypothetical protein
MNKSVDLGMKREDLNLGDRVVYNGHGGQKLKGTVVHIPSLKSHKSCVVRLEKGLPRMVEISRLEKVGG